jgi:hypothetical protein
MESNFSDILLDLKLGRRAYRLGWNGIKLGRDMFVYLHSFEGFKPCFIFENEDVKHPGWMPSIWDLLANDWVLKQE